MSRQSVWRRVQWGWYESLPRQVYRDVAVPMTDRTRWFAAALGIGRGAVVACHSACQAYGLGSAIRDSTVHVVVKCTCPHPTTGVTVHRSLTLRPGHVTTIAGLPVTTMARTLCDVAGRVGPIRLRRLLAEAVRRGLTDPMDLRATMNDVGKFRGKVALGDLLDELSPLQAVTASALESEFLHLMSEAGLAPTAVNHPVVDAEGTTRFIDAVYLPERLPIELDSHLAHGSLLDWNDDTRRENRIVLTGWRAFLRFNWADVTRHGAAVVDTVRRALAAQD